MDTKEQNNCVMAVEYMAQTLGKLSLGERNGLLGMVAEGSGILGRILVKKTCLRSSDVEENKIKEQSRK